MSTPQIISIAIFVVVMAVIASEKLHRATVALAGAALVLALGLMPFDTAVGHIDFNTLGVLCGMMLFVGVVRHSGLFEYLAIRSSQVAGGDPWRVMVALVVVTAVLSAFLDNVTTVLLVGPMTVTICKLLDMNPIPFFMTEIMASNIGGTATLIGDPPNIMIGSAAGFTFFDFIRYDAPCAVIALVVVVVVFRFVYGRRMGVVAENSQRIMDLDASESILDRRLFARSVAMIAVVIAGFMLHGRLHLESSVVALAAAAVMLVIGGVDIEEVIPTVEWSTIGFFCGLFIIVGAMSETGVIGMLANWLLDVTGGRMVVAMLVVLWASAVISSILDNIPFVATMIPIITAMGAAGVDVMPLWWALSLGACLGGNGTLIGASANVVLASIAGREGHPITFVDFLKVGFPIMILTTAVATVYLLVIF